MSKSSLFGPEGFTLLRSMPRLWYKVEDDGGVLITGSPAKCVFSKDVPNFGKISGGIKMDGARPVVFGDHHYNHRRLPLRWVELEKASKLPPPKDRRNVPGQHPWKDPARARDQEVARVKAKWEEQRKRAEEDERRRQERNIDRSRWIPKATYDQVVEERDKLKKSLSEIEGKIEEMRKAATTIIDGIRAEFKRRMNIRSVHLEATLTGRDQIEGHRTEHWEVGDKKYLVIAETPSGLGRGNWADDITRALNRMAGMEEVGVAIVPQGASVRVVELVPFTDVEDDLDSGQF